MDDSIGNDYGARSISGPPSTSCASAEAKAECALTFIREYTSTPYVGMTWISHRHSTKHWQSYLTPEGMISLQILHRQT